MTEAARLSIPLMSSNRKPFGQVVLAAEGHAQGHSFDVTVTDCEIHFAFSGVDGPAFSIDLNRLVKTAAYAIEDRLFGQKGRMR